jgi:hypothetical protein
VDKHTIFISHAHADNALCDPYAKALSDLGLDVWYDRTNMEYAQLISDVIGRELQKRTALVVLLTPSAVASGWVGLEIATYLSYWTKDRDRRIILPVMLSDCEVPPMLHSFKRIDASLMSRDEVIDAVARTLGVEPSPKRREVVRQVNTGATPTPFDVPPDADATPTERIFIEWLAFVEEKWRAVNDSQLGWKPLRGQWTGWDDIYHDVYPFEDESAVAVDALKRRFENAQTKGSAASAVAGFLHDLDALRRALGVREKATPPVTPPRRSPYIRNPMIVDADDSE